MGTSGLGWGFMLGTVALAVVITLTALAVVLYATYLGHRPLHALAA